MAITKQMNLKNRTYYCYNEKKTFKGINIHYIGYVTKKRRIQDQ